jgi:hypothetical protein
MASSPRLDLLSDIVIFAPLKTLSGGNVSGCKSAAVSICNTRGGSREDERTKFFSLCALSFVIEDTIVDRLYMLQMAESGRS